MNRRDSVRPLYTCAILCLLLQLNIHSSEVPGMLASKGIDSTEFNSLVKQGFVSSTILNGEKYCETTDRHTLSDKLLLSDLVFVGKISRIEYLYKQGGPFRTLYTISIIEAWKGSAGSEIQVLSTFGPNRRDHRRWKRDPIGVELEAGDEGLFMVSTSILEGGRERRPNEVNDFLNGKGMFVDGTNGVYLMKDGEFDRDFTLASRKREQTIRLADAQSTMHSIAKILGRE